MSEFGDFIAKLFRICLANYSIRDKKMTRLYLKHLFSKQINLKHFMTSSYN